MPRDEYETLSSDPVVRIAKAVVPWVVLGALLWALSGSWGEFVVAKRAVDASTASSETTVTTSTVASTGTTVTSTVAVTRVAVSLRSQPSTSSSVLATAKKGSKLTVLSRKGTWYRVKDASGHIGWIPNNAKYITLSKTK
jgi:uncharacterized protein YraI